MEIRLTVFYPMIGGYYFDSLYGLSLNERQNCNNGNEYDHWETVKKLLY